MFNYTKEVIINSADAVLNAAALGTGLFGVKRGGNYKIANIVGNKVYKTAGVAGSKATATITVQSLGTADVARLTIYLSTPRTEFVEFGSPNWQEFGKPFIIETKAASVADMKAAIKLALNEDNKLFSISDNTVYYTDADEASAAGKSVGDVKTAATNVVLTAAETWMDFAEVNYDLVTFGTDGYETVASQASNVALTHSTPEFGTAKWIVENLRFPSQPNLRYTPLYADEAPVAGTTYNQYSFQYKVEKSVPGGLAAVGQVVDSIVTIVFYVPASSAAETALVAAIGAGLVDTTSAKPAA